MSRADRDRLAARAEDLIDHLVRHDALTELPNRVMFRDCVGEAIADARRPGALVAVVILGLDRFQAINDSWGPPFGDLVLQAIGRRLSGALLEGDTAARLGGDQFGMLRPTIHTADQAGALARRLLESIARPICIDRCEVYPAATAVVALYPTDAGEADGLIRDAEIAMHRAKAAGGHRVRFYTAEMNARSLDRLLLENGLHRALERNELRVHYQPQLSLAERRIAGLEALLRWKPAYRTSVDTADVIAVADESGLIVPIGEWVLRTACADLASWHRAGHTGLRVSVNLSARQLAWGGLVSVVAHALRDAELDPSCLELEITENSLLENSPGADETLRRLKALGVRLALDDFGSGYSSLTHLKRFPIDILKIDRSFIHDLVSSRSDAAITRAIISMAHALDLAVIAEGVERHDQLELLRAEGCDFVQGYLIGRPMPAGQVPETLRRLPGGESAGASRPSGLDLGLTPALRLAGARDGADGLADQLGERHPEERAGRDIARVMGADVNSAEAD